VNESHKVWPVPMVKVPWFRILWVCALGFSFYLSVGAARRGGFVGPDYNLHFYRMTEAPKILDFSTTDPPVYYLLGRGLFKLIGPTNAFPITLSIIQVAINCLALWWFFLYSESRFRLAVTHLTLVFFLTFLPVRIIHAVTIGTDCLTVPVFVLVLLFFGRFLSDRTATPRNAAFLGLALALGICSKYSFMALLPAIFVAFVFFWVKRSWSVKRFAVICALALALPSAFSAYNFWASAHGAGYSTHQLWLPKGVPADLTYKDLFSVKTKDALLFDAPEYFKKEILEAHKHSYLGLSHLGVFTDTMNLFQVFQLPPNLSGYLIPDMKTRTPWKTTVMRASMLLGVLWTLLALIGTIWISIRALKNLWRDKLEREEAAMLLGVSYFLLMFLPLPFIYASVLFGYWTPRLILPSLLCFFWGAFLLIDKKIVRGSPHMADIVLALVLVQCAIEITMLI
jgi:4-amino-4-deoxy-L-arabinose transferase-like glycosyltransferase